jgi:hypothetical protein
VHTVLSSLVMSRERREFAISAVQQLPLLFHPASLVTFRPTVALRAGPVDGRWPLPLAPGRSPLPTVPGAAPGSELSLEQLRSPVGMSHPINIEQLPESSK